MTNQEVFEILTKDAPVPDLNNNHKLYAGKNPVLSCGSVILSDEQEKQFQAEVDRLLNERPSR